MNPYMLSLDQLKAHLSSMKAEFDRREIRVMEELIKTVKGHMQRGAVLHRVGTFDRDTWFVTRRTKNVVWCQDRFFKSKKMSRTRRVDLSTATYSVFAHITMIKHNGKVVYRRYDFLRKHKATCLNDSWTFK